MARRAESARLAERVSRIPVGASDRSDGAAAPLIGFDPALLVRVDELEGLLASWQTIGGCGAGAGASFQRRAQMGRANVSGGLFNVQEQVSYSNIGSRAYPEHNFFVNTFINADVTEKWNLGVIIPLVYKYLDDPLHLAPDVPAVNYSNGGLGDVSLLVTRRLGRINATSLTGIVGLPTGVWDATYTPAALT